MMKRYKTDGIGKVLVGGAMLVGALASAAIAADPVPIAPVPIATASSEWGAGNAAAMAADRIAGEKNNYWQTVKDTDKGAWWQVDLGTTTTVTGVAISWANYEDKIVNLPARAVVQLSNQGTNGPWIDARAITPTEVPRDGAPYPQAESRYMLDKPLRARYVRILFPDGSQAGAKYPGYLCLGEVEVLAPELAPTIMSIEGPFGKAEIDVSRARMTRLYLRGPSGLSEQSLLAECGERTLQGAYTYVVAPDGRRFESRFLPNSGTVDVQSQDGRTVLRLQGISLSDPKGAVAAMEDWTLSAPGAGTQLVWQIERRWLCDFNGVSRAGTPGLFFAFSRQYSNSVTSTLWYDPAGLDPKPVLVSGSSLYTGENEVTTRDRDPWAIYKLWTTWHAPFDLRLDCAGGYLYRRGNFSGYGNMSSEIGAVSSNAACGKGQVEQFTLRISPVERHATGYQLAIRLPDRDTEASLRDFYNGVFNGGAVNDQKNYDFGNESDGWYYAGSCWMYGLTLAAGTPASGALSSRPYDAARAFRGHLANVLATLDDQGRTRFGYNGPGHGKGAWVDDNLHVIQGVRSYLLHSGDLDAVRLWLPKLESMLAYFVKRRGTQGLFELEKSGAHWYYDIVPTTGINSYYNAFFYKAALDLAEMEGAAGFADKAVEYRRLASEIRVAFNQVLWRDNLKGGARYLDWIGADGKGEVSDFYDLCQWPAVAVGLASPEQARKIVATADVRILELEKEYGYQGFACLSKLWNINGKYMSGGSLLAQTYWEIMARTRAGDAQGAAKRLTLFARRFREISWSGNNAADIHGNTVGSGGDGEPYLADMVVVSSAVVHGLMGIEPTWDKLTVTPHLPTNWPWAEAEILYKGQRQRVRVEGTNVNVKAVETSR
jgi:hypothetical protein